LMAPGATPASSHAYWLIRGIYASRPEVDRVAQWIRTEAAQTEQASTSFCKSALKSSAGSDAAFFAPTK